MKVTLTTRSGKVLSESYEIRDDCTVEAFKSSFEKQHGYYPERQWWNVGSAKGSVLNEGRMDALVKNGDTLVFKDLGIQISWRLVYVIEYLGPLIIFPFFYYCPGFIYGESVVVRSVEQDLALYLTMIHYLKRELESLFVHRFSKSTMPFERLPINCLHYWVFFALFTAIFLYKPTYSAPWSQSRTTQYVPYVLAALILVFEVLNGLCHWTLRQLRARNTKTRGVPHGWGFQWVACANYWWECCIWFCFALLVNVLTCWFFLFLAVRQMGVWAVKRHADQQKLPGCPPGRYAMIPFVL